MEKFSERKIPELASHYYRLGINVLPIVKGGKAPVGKWQKLQYERQTEAEFSAINFDQVEALGAITGYNQIWAIDFDPHKEETVPEEVARKALKLLGLADNYPWLVSTGKGFHVWIQSEENPFNSTKNVQRIDAREDSGFHHLELRIKGNTLLPGSLHPTGRIYTPVSGSLPIEPPQRISRTAVERMVKEFCPDPTEAKKKTEKAKIALPSRIRLTHNEPPLELAAKKIREATDGNKWDTIRKQAYFIGGIIGDGRLEYSTAYQTLKQAVESLSNVEDLNHAIKTLEEGLKDGQLRPLKKITNHQPDEASFLTKTGERIEQAERFIESRWDIRYNLIRNRKEVFEEGKGKREFRDSDLADIYTSLHRSGIDIKKNDLETLLQSNFIPQYNPLTEWFESREGWIPEEGQIKDLAQSLIQSTYSPDQWENFLRKWLVGTVAGIKPERFNILQLVLFGKQNIGKTEFFERLIPKDLKEYCTSNQLDKEAERLMCEFWIIIDDEYSGKTKGDSKRLKYLLSQRYFTFRIPYSKNPVKADRVASLCGSTNEPEILADTTGNRRVIPVDVKARDFKAFDGIDKEAVWMEAYKLLQSGFNYELSKEEIQMLNNSTGEFERYSSEYELICKYVEETPLGSGEEFTATEIASHISRYSNLKISKVILGKELARLGYKQYTKKRNGKSQRLYSVKLLE